MTDADGNLPAALDHLHTAISAIANPIKGWYVEGVKLAPSLYEQLAGDLPARAGERAGKFHHASTPPCFVDALELRVEIDAAIKHFDPAGTSTLDRLRRIASGRYRPQDAERLERLAAELERWTAAIHNLLEPAHVKTISAPCPACSATHAYRRNNIGETVRQPALQIVAAIGCRCLACNTSWPPEKYLWLLNVLGFETPAGIVG